MKKIATYILMVIGCATICHKLSAQPIAIPYQIGFEKSDAQEIALRWHLNPGALATQCKDQWVIGDATYNEGQQALYISCDQGETPTFSTDTCVQFAYCDLTLPDGIYYVSFDWRCFGTEHAKFYAGMGRKSAIPDSLLVAVRGRSTLPRQLNSFVFPDCNGIYNSANWKSTTSNMLRVQSPNNQLRLFFVWSTSNAQAEHTMNLAACIDNLQISNALSPIPTNIRDSIISCDSVYIMWEGRNEYYEFEYRKHGSAHWIKHTGLTQKYFLLEGLTEGLYDYRVRGLDLDTIHSAYCCRNNAVVYCPEMHCINFVQLSDPNVCTPWIGQYTNPFQLQRLVDYGSGDMYSRHVVNMDHDLYDKRTDYQLPLIPPGELASVRLGNWNVKAECEALSFRYFVDAENAAILLLKYAIVLQDPVGHNDEEKPQFTLEITNQSGEVIDPTCGRANFVAGKNTNGNGWHKNTRYPTTVLWKEWTTIGIDLSDYDQQWINIRLTTYDCLLQGHYGYAYFTLSCANAKIYSSSCGDEPQVSIDAPDGFYYQWYDNQGVEVPVSKGGRSLSLQLESSDTTTYTCMLTSKENPECVFFLSTANIPQYPYSEFAAEYSAAECQNKLRFVNTSHIITRPTDDSIAHHYDQQCEDYEWEIVNTTLAPNDTIYRDDPSPVLYPPEGGGRYHATLTSYISNRACYDEKELWIDVPAIGDRLATIDTTICYGDYPIKLGDETSTPQGPKYYGSDTTITLTWQTMAGCDSVEQWNIHVHPQSMTLLPDTTICADDSLIIDGEKYPYKTSGRFVIFRTNAHGCDSTIQLNVTVLDSILPTIEMKNIEDDREYSGELTFSGSGYSYYYLNGEYHPASDTHITGLNGGEFMIEFYNDFGCSSLYTTYMDYPCRNMIFQRWGDVLSIMNEQVMSEQYPQYPPMEFTSFQWMRDSVDIPGATKSYYYEQDGLSTTGFYQVRVTTLEGGTLISCPFYPETYMPPQQVPYRKVIENQQLIIIVNGVKYNSMGEKLE